ncbi:hypothetical protein EDB84DRAFT_1271018, partial [Lactarius hengduanensis]
VYTDDARRKLGEGVRRWCFNCRAVDTSTWRRSSLSQGKLLCNKCGLYERTHRVARPDKFPRKDGHDLPPHPQSQVTLLPVVANIGNIITVIHQPYHQPYHPHNVFNPLMPLAGNQSHNARHGRHRTRPALLHILLWVVSGILPPNSRPCIMGKCNYNPHYLLLARAPLPRLGDRYFFA